MVGVVEEEEEGEGEEGERVVEGGEGGEGARVVVMEEAAAASLVLGPGRHRSARMASQFRAHAPRFAESSSTLRDAKAARSVLYMTRASQRGT